MFLKDPIDDNVERSMGNANTTLRTVIGISVAITLASIIFINPLLEMINYYVQISGF